MKTNNERERKTEQEKPIALRTHPFLHVLCCLGVLVTYNQSPDDNILHVNLNAEIDNVII